MDQFQSAVPDFYVGSDDVDATPKQLVANGYAPDSLMKGVRIRAESTNTGTLYVGPNSGVSATNGFPLVKSETIDVPVDKPQKVWIVAVPSGNSVQTVTIANLVATGKWTLTYDGQTTTAMSATALHATVQAALEALSTIGAGNVTVSGEGSPYTVTFVGSLAGKDVQLLTGECVNELQTIAITNALAGDQITLTYSAETAVAFTYGDSADMVQAVLEDLTSIGEGNVDVTAVSGGYTVEFIGDLADTDVSAITGVGGQNEKQTITVTNGIASDKMVLSIGGHSTGSLNYNLTGAALQTALEAVEDIGAGQVSVTGNGPYEVEFTGTLAKTDVGAITGVGGQNEKQTITVSAAAAGDTMVITVGAAGNTSAVAYNVSGADLQSALEAIPAVGAGNVTVTGDGPYLLEFVGALAKTNIATVTGVGGKNEKQTITLTSATGGTFTLTYVDQSTSALAYNSTTAQVHDALEGLSNVGAGQITVTGVAGAWIVEFTGTLAKMNVDMLVANAAALTPVAAVAVVEEVKGVAATTNEQQSVTVTNASGGTFTLTYESETTAPISFGATAAAVHDAFEALSTVGAGQATVTGDAGGPYTVEFTGTLAQTDVGAITADATALVKTSVAGVAQTTASNVLTVTSTPVATGNTLTVGVTQDHTGNTATVVVTESIKGDADGTVVAAKVSDASDGCSFSWVAA